MKPWAVHSLFSLIVHGWALGRQPSRDDRDQSTHNCIVVHNNFNCCLSGPQARKGWKPLIYRTKLPQDAAMVVSGCNGFKGGLNTFAEIEEDFIHSYQPQWCIEPPCSEAVYLWIPGASDKQRKPFVASLEASVCHCWKQDAKRDESHPTQWLFCAGLVFWKMDWCMGQRHMEALVHLLFVKKQKLLGVVQRSIHSYLARLII